MDITPITTEEAIKAVLKGEILKYQEIPDFRALIEGIQERASNPDKILLECTNCFIVECQCRDIEITFDIELNGTTFSEDVYFGNTTFTRNADFSGTTFTQDANFWRTRFRDNAIFVGATFKNGANFSAATFSKSTYFRHATFSETADFFLAKFTSDTHFGETTFTKNKVLRGNFVGVNFKWANFNECSLKDNRDGVVANLDEANLEQTKGLILDSTPIRNAKFSPRATDPWSQLRRAYTGPRLVFTLIFLVAFFTPYVLKTVGWVGMNRVQAELNQHIDKVRDKIEALELESHTLAQPLRVAVDKMADVASELSRGNHIAIAQKANTAVDEVNLLVNQLEQERHVLARPLTVALDAVADRLPQHNDDRWQTKSVWELVLGMDKHWLFPMTSIVLIIYNLCRIMLTWIVAPMRDAEERSGVSPAYQRDTSYAPKKEKGLKAVKWPCQWVKWWLGTFTEAYGWMIWPSRIVGYVLIIAIGSFLYHAFFWLRLPVIMPATSG